MVQPIAASRPHQSASRQPRPAVRPTTSCQGAITGRVLQMPERTFSAVRKESETAPTGSKTVRPSSDGLPQRAMTGSTLRNFLMRRLPGSCGIAGSDGSGTPQSSPFPESAQANTHSNSALQTSIPQHGGTAKAHASIARRRAPSSEVPNSSQQKNVPPGTTFPIAIPRNGSAPRNRGMKESAASEMMNLNAPDIAQPPVHKAPIPQTPHHVVPNVSKSVHSGSASLSPNMGLSRSTNPLTRNRPHAVREQQCTSRSAGGGQVRKADVSDSMNHFTPHHSQRATALGADVLQKSPTSPPQRNGDPAVMPHGCDVQGASAKRVRAAGTFAVPENTKFNINEVNQTCNRNIPSSSQAQVTYIRRTQAAATQRREAFQNEILHISPADRNVRSAPAWRGRSGSNIAEGNIYQAQQRQTSYQHSLIALGASTGNGFSPVHMARNAQISTRAMEERVGQNEHHNNQTHRRTVSRGIPRPMPRNKASLPPGNVPGQGTITGKGDVLCEQKYTNITHDMKMQRPRRIATSEQVHGMATNPVPITTHKVSPRNTSKSQHELDLMYLFTQFAAEMSRQVYLELEEEISPVTPQRFLAFTRECYQTWAATMGSQNDAHKVIGIIEDKFKRFYPQAKEIRLFHIFKMWKIRGSLYGEFRNDVQMLCGTRNLAGSKISAMHEGKYLQGTGSSNARIPNSRSELWKAYVSSAVKNALRHHKKLITSESNNFTSAGPSQEMATPFIPASTNPTAIMSAAISAANARIRDSTKHRPTLSNNKGTNLKNRQGLGLPRPPMGSPPNGEDEKVVKLKLDRVESIRRIVNTAPEEATVAPYLPATRTAADFDKAPRNPITGQQEAIFPSPRPPKSSVGNTSTVRSFNCGVVSDNKQKSAGHSHSIVPKPNSTGEESGLTTETDEHLTKPINSVLKGRKCESTKAASANAHFKSNNDFRGVRTKAMNVESMSYRGAGPLNTNKGLRDGESSSGAPRTALQFSQSSGKESSGALAERKFTSVKTVLDSIQVWDSNKSQGTIDRPLPTASGLSVGAVNYKVSKGPFPSSNVVVERARAEGSIARTEPIGCSVMDNGTGRNFIPRNGVSGNEAQGFVNANGRCGSMGNRDAVTRTPRKPIVGRPALRRTSLAGSIVGRLPANQLDVKLKPHDGKTTGPKLSAVPPGSNSTDRLPKKRSKSAGGATRMHTMGEGTSAVAILDSCAQRKTISAANASATAGAIMPTTGSSVASGMPIDAPKVVPQGAPTEPAPNPTTVMTGDHCKDTDTPMTDPIMADARNNENPSQRKCVSKSSKKRLASENPPGEAPQKRRTIAGIGSLRKDKKGNSKSKNEYQEPAGKDTASPEGKRPESSKTAQDGRTKLEKAYFLKKHRLLKKVTKTANELDLTVSEDVFGIIATAARERVKFMLERMKEAAQHRREDIRTSWNAVPDGPCPSDQLEEANRREEAMLRMKAIDRAQKRKEEKVKPAPISVFLLEEAAKAPCGTASRKLSQLERKEKMRLEKEKMVQESQKEALSDLLARYSKRHTKNEANPEQDKSGIGKTATEGKKPSLDLTKALPKFGGVKRFNPCNTSQREGKASVLPEIGSAMYKSGLGLTRSGHEKPDKTQKKPRLTLRDCLFVVEFDVMLRKGNLAAIYKSRLGARR